MDTHLYEAPCRDDSEPGSWEYEKATFGRGRGGNKSKPTRARRIAKRKAQRAARRAQRS